MSEPKSYLNKLTIHQLEELIPSTHNFERTEKKLNNAFVEYWISLRMLIGAVVADKKG